MGSPINYRANYVSLPAFNQETSESEAPSFSTKRQRELSPDLEFDNPGDVSERLPKRHRMDALEAAVAVCTIESESDGEFDVSGDAPKRHRMDALEAAVAVCTIESESDGEFDASGDGRERPAKRHRMDALAEAVCTIGSESDGEFDASGDVQERPAKRHRMDALAAAVVSAIGSESDGEFDASGDGPNRPQMESLETTFDACLRAHSPLRRPSILGSLQRRLRPVTSWERELQPVLEAPISPPKVPVRFNVRSAVKKLGEANKLNDHVRRRLFLDKASEAFEIYCDDARCKQDASVPNSERDRAYEERALRYNDLMKQSHRAKNVACNQIGRAVRNVEIQVYDPLGNKTKRAVKDVDAPLEDLVR